jgi:hypothetical protein
MPQRFWHIKVTLSGAPCAPRVVGASLQRLADQHPFLLSGRYASDHAEVHYWEEAGDAEEASALALQMWAQNRKSAALPDWAVVGLEVLERDAYRERADTGHGLAGGDIRPY